MKERCSIFKLLTSSKCNKCNGRGFTVERVQMMGMIMNTQQPCRHCGGKGETVAERCHVCGGRRVSPAQKTFDVTVEKGMQNGQTIVFEGESEQSPDYLPGDVMQLY